jgi:invasion protein IalB
MLKRNLLVLAGLLVTIGSAGAVFAQTAPPAKGKAPAPAAQQPPAAQGPQSAWVKLCEKAPFGKIVDGKEVREDRAICLTHHERLDGNTGMVLVSAAVRTIEGDAKQHFMVMVPLGMAIQPGLKAAVYNPELWAKLEKNEAVDDKLLKPIDLRFTICHPAGCTAEFEATPDLLAAMQGGGGIMVLAINAAAQPIGFPVPLIGFKEALVGKAVDNAAYGEARGKLLGQIRERQQVMIEEWKKKQPQQPGAAPPPPTTGATPPKKTP